MLGFWYLLITILTHHNPGCVEAVSDRFCIQSNGTVNITLSFMDEVCCGDAGGCDGGDPYVFH